MDTPARVTLKVDPPSVIVPAAAAPVSRFSAIDTPASTPPELKVAVVSGVCDPCEPAPVIIAVLVSEAAEVTHVAQAIVPVVVIVPPVIGEVVAIDVTPPPHPEQDVTVSAPAEVTFASGPRLSWEDVLLTVSGNVPLEEPARVKPRASNVPLVSPKPPFPAARVAAAVLDNPVSGLVVEANWMLFP